MEKSCHNAVEEPQGIRGRPNYATAGLLATGDLGVGTILQPNAPEPLITGGQGRTTDRLVHSVENAGLTDVTSANMNMFASRVVMAPCLPSPDPGGVHVPSQEEGSNVAPTNGAPRRKSCAREQTAHTITTPASSSEVLVWL